jgi:hypothetical protein
MSTTLKSIGAVFAGLLFIVITHTILDFIFEKIDLLPHGNLYTSTGIILFVISYRALFSLFGCYLTALLAPQKPMKHALILGGIGTLLSLVGVIVNAKMKLGPDWYAWSLVVIAMPIAWLGGKLYLRKKTA